MKKSQFYSMSALASAGILGNASLETKEAKEPTSTEIKTAVEAVNKTFNDFKDANDLRLKEIEKLGTASAETEAKLAKIDEAMTKQQAIMDGLELAAKRTPIQLDEKGNQLSQDQIDHKSAFANFMRKGDDANLADLQVKALSVGVDADGGYAVPEFIDNMVHSLAYDISPIRSIATVITTGTSDYKKLVNLHGAAATWQGEAGTTANSATPKLEQIAPPGGFLEARPRATQQMLDDGLFNMEQWLADEVSLSFALAEGAAFINGDGNNKPRGFLSGAAPTAADDGNRAFGTLQFQASGAAAALPTSGDPYIDMIYSLKAMHRADARWVAGRKSLAEMRKIKDNEGQYLWVPSLSAGQPSTFLGYAITEAEDMPDVAANAFPVAFGNFRAGYLITDRFGMRVQRDPFTAKPFVEFYTTKRVGGAVIDSEAIKLMKITA